jgi:two-component system nitrate/nitrite response regulator NarL
MPEARPSVFIVDDHSFFRAGLRSMLTEHGFTVVGDAPSGLAALPLIERRRPDVVVMDLSMPGMSGVEATRAVTAQFRSIAVLVMTVSATATDVLDALEAGAAGYLLKDSEPDEIVRAVRAALDGDTPLSPHVAGMIAHRARAVAGGAEAAAHTLAALTERERAVLKLVAEGRDNAEIAHALYLSPTTVKRHVSAILLKLGVTNRVQAAIWAVRVGLI